MRQLSDAGSADQGCVPILLHFDGIHWAQQAIHTDTSPIGLQIAGLAMVSPTDGWAVGTYLGGMSPAYPPSAVVVRCHAGSWIEVARYAAPAGVGVFALNAVAVTAKRDGWALGTGGLHLRLHGGGPTPDTAQSSVAAQPNLWGVAMSSLGDGWAVGDHGTILRYHGAGCNAYTP